MILVGQSLMDVAELALEPAPTDVDPMSVDIHVAGGLSLEPRSFGTVAAFEQFDMPRHVGALLTGRSTHMRRGINTPMGWIDPGKQGEVMLEFFNMSDEAQYLERGEAAARLVFFQLSDEVPGYDGKWQ